MKGQVVHAAVGDDDQVLRRQLGPDHGYLIDEFSISYAPSANVYALCAGKEPSRGDGAPVLGVPTGDAPGIRREVEAVAELLPRATLRVEEQATEEMLREEGADARLLHIATHGFFRQDNRCSRPSSSAVPG